MHCTVHNLRISELGVPVYSSLPLRGIIELLLWVGGGKSITKLCLNLFMKIRIKWLEGACSLLFEGQGG